MAAYNTEYQTHYLNVAYTPNKAIGLMIAAEAAQKVGRGESFGNYPADTLFNDFRVSYVQDLSELNDGEKFRKIFLSFAQLQVVANLRW